MNKSEPVLNCVLLQCHVNDNDIVIVLGAVRRIAELLGCEVDVEWAEQAGTIIVLQARPITAVGTAIQRADLYHFWWSGNGSLLWLRELQSRAYVGDNSQAS